MTSFLMEKSKIDASKIISEGQIQTLLKIQTDSQEIDEILQKAEEKKGLSLKDCAKLLSIQTPQLLEKLFESAKKIKQAIYGPRLVLFAPLYISNFCINDCAYCAFHTRNPTKRKKLTLKEIQEQVKTLEAMGHKRLLLECGEHPTKNPIDYVIKAIETIYSTKQGQGEIRRVNVNIAATTTEDYRKLKAVGIGTYQLFQETYHRATYQKLHCGPKADYNRQITAMFRAFEAGLDDLGIGVLFGLYDYRFEVLALIQYAQFMDQTLGVGPHTISVPRLQPAYTVDLDSKYKVSDVNFLKIIAILRLAVPYTGMIISTRESPQIRRKAFDIGISQASAASKTQPGGYKKSQNTEEKNQFHLNDLRNLDEVVQDICDADYLPSFCTACYRSKRTGDAFMKLAKSGEIHNLCHPNAILTFKEYLLDYASLETKKTGEKTIFKQIQFIKSRTIKKKLKNRLKELENGKRDLYF